MPITTEERERTEEAAAVSDSERLADAALSLRNDARTFADAAKIFAGRFARFFYSETAGERRNAAGLGMAGFLAVISMHLLSNPMVLLMAAAAGFVVAAAWYWRRRIALFAAFAWAHAAQTSARFASRAHRRHARFGFAARFAARCSAAAARQASRFFRSSR